MRIVMLIALGLSPAFVANATWRNLVVVDEYRCSEYSASDYRYSPSLENRIIEKLGRAFSPYTGVWFASSLDTDIEHIVARSEAHDSGLCAASVDLRRVFASDPLNLTLAAPELNRRIKADKDAAEWLPVSNRCWFADTIVRVKRKYGLTVDLLEAAALERVLRACPTVAMQLTPEPVTAIAPPPSPLPPPFQPQPVFVALGDSGQVITLFTAEDGGWTLNGFPVYSGSLYHADDGYYRLTLTAGVWSAAIWTP